MKISKQAVAVALVTGCALAHVTPIVAAQAPAAAAQGAQAGKAKDMHDGPWLGTWKRRSATPNAGGEWIMKMWKENDGIRYTIDVKQAQGTPTHMEAWVRFDGKPASRIL